MARKPVNNFLVWERKSLGKRRYDLLLDRDSEVLIENVMKNLTSEAIENIIVSVCIN